MRDPAFAGNCLTCNTPTYGQSHCEVCEDGAGETVCRNCGNSFTTEDELNECYDHFFLVETKLQEEYLGDLLAEVRQLRAKNEINKKTIEDFKTLIADAVKTLTTIKHQLSPEPREDFAIKNLAINLIRMQVAGK